MVHQKTAAKQSEILTGPKQTHKKKTTIRRKINLKKLSHLGKLHSSRSVNICAVGWETRE
jgi:hypothetical protein